MNITEWRQRRNLGPREAAVLADTDYSHWTATERFAYANLPTAIRNLIAELDGEEAAREAERDYASGRARLRLAVLEGLAADR